jgi:hypothetical protein
MRKRRKDIAENYIVTSNRLEFEKLRGFYRITAMKECLRRQSPLDLRRIYGTTEVVP